MTYAFIIELIHEELFFNYLLFLILAKFKRASRVLSVFEVIFSTLFHFSNDLVFISLNDKIIIHIL